MPDITIDAILWRSLNQATYDSLAGVSRGQYDIRLTRSPKMEAFFANLPHHDPTALGGFTLHVPFAAYDGPGPVPAQELDVRYIGNASGRRDWYIPSQRPESAYPLWRLDRNAGLAAGRGFVIIARDARGSYHGRMFTDADVAALPAEIATALRNKEVDVMFFDTAADAARSLAASLRSSLNVLLYGPPATGKTHRVNEAIASLRQPVVSTSKEHDAIRVGGDHLKVAFVTFHQSYTYEEFMVSLMPDPEAGRFFALTAKRGVLLQLAEHAREPGNESLLIIDEINRGNVSRIFGEFITAMEPDKRLGHDGQRTPTTVVLQLPYLSEPVILPPRLYTLATMNSVDESVAPLDAALRRRFEVIDVPPNVEELRMAFNLSDDWRTLDTGDGMTGVQLRALRLLELINARIAPFRGAQAQLGQWYFAPLLNAENADVARSALLSVWWRRIVPQLEELFSGQPEQLAAVLRLTRRSGEALSIEDPSAGDADLGAHPVVRKNPDPGLTLAFIDRLLGAIKAPTAGAPQTAEPERSAGHPGPP
jgi:MoxR-like ATPase